MDITNIYNRYKEINPEITEDIFNKTYQDFGDEYLNVIENEIKKKDYPPEEITPIQGKMAGIQMPENTNLPTIDTQSIPNPISLLPTEQSIQNIHQDSSVLGTSAEPISTVSELGNGVSSLGEKQSETNINPAVEEPLIDNIKPSVNKQFYGIDANGETILISAKNFTQTDKNLIAKDGNTYPIYEREGLSFIDTNEGLKLVGKDGDVSQYPVFGRDFEFYKGKFLLNSEKEDQPTDYYQERRKNFHYVAGGRLSSGVAEKDISGNYISLEDETALYKSYESKGYGNIVGIDEQSQRPIFQLNEVGAETLNKQNGFSVPSDYEKGKAYALDSNRVMSNINEGKEIEDNERQRQERILGRKVDGALLTEEEINEELIAKRTQQLVLQGLNNQQALEQAGREFASSQQQKRNETNNWIDYIISEAERNAEPYNASNGKSFKYHQFTNSERETWQSLRDDINFAEFINSDYAKNKYGTKGDGLEYHFENSKLRKSFLNDYVQYKQKQINDNRRALNSTRDRQLRTDIRVAIDNGDDDALAVARGKREPIERAYQSIQQKALSNSILANKIENGFDIIKKEDEELAKEYAGYQNGRFGDIVSYTGKSIINGGGKLITDIAGGLLSLGGMFSDRINSAHTAFNVENAQVLNILSGNTTDKVTVYKKGNTIVEERLGRMFIKGKDGKLTFSEELTYNPKAFEGYEKKDQYTDENIANWAGIITNQVGMMYIPSVGGGLLAKATANSARLNKVIAASANALGKEHMLTKSLVSFSHNSKNLYTSALWATEVQNQNYSEAKNSGLTKQQSGIYSLIQSGLTGVMVHISPDDKFFKGYDAAKKELISLVAKGDRTKISSFVVDYLKKAASSNIGELSQEHTELIAQNIVNSAFNSAIGEDKLRTWEIDELFETTKSTLGVTTFLETFNYLTRGRIKTRGLNAMEKMVVASQIPEIQRQLQEVENGIWSSSLKQDARDALQYIDKIQKYTKQIPDDVQLKVSETASLVMSMDKIAEYEKKKNETTYPSIKESYEDKIQAENEKIKNILSNANKQTSDGNNANDNAPEEQSNSLEEDKNNNNTITGVNSGELPANNEQEANSRTEEIQQIEQGKPIENHISTPTSAEQGNTTEEEEQALPITAENKVPETKAEENAPEDDVEEDIDYIEDENGINDKLSGLSPVNGKTQNITPSNSVEAQPTKENLSKEGQGDESNLQGIQTPPINEIEGEILMEGNNNIPTTPTSTNQATTEEVKPLNKGRKIEYNNKEYYPRPDGGFNAFDKNGKLRKVTNKDTIAKLKELSNGENEAKQKAEDWIAYKNKRVTKTSTAKVPETKESKGNVLHWRTLFNSVNDEQAKIQVLVDKLWHSNKDMSDSDLTDMLDVAEQLSDNYNDKYRIFDTMRRATNNQDILNRAKRLDEEFGVRREQAYQERVNKAGTNRENVEPAKSNSQKEAPIYNTPESKEVQVLDIGDISQIQTNPNSNDDVDFQVSEDYSSLSDRELKDEIQRIGDKIKNDIAGTKGLLERSKARINHPLYVVWKELTDLKIERYQEQKKRREEEEKNNPRVVYTPKREELKISEYNGERTVYHGTKKDVADKIVKEGIKFGSELSDTDWRGGGYGVLDQEYFSTSLNPNISKYYSGEHNVGIVKLELNPGANVVTIENEIYAEDLKEYQKELEGVDAVYLKNSGEEELVILNKEAVKVVEAKSFKVSENVVRFQKNKNTPYKKGKISQKAFDKLIAKLKKPFAKAFKNINILTDWNEFEKKVEAYRKRKEVSYSIKTLWEKAISTNVGTETITLGNISEKGKKELEKLSGLSFDKVDYININQSNLRHIYKDHFGENEKDKGNNIPLSERDIEYIPDIINSPNEIIYGKNKDGVNMFFFLKEDKYGTMNVVQAYSGKNRNLNIRSVYKTKKGFNQRADEIISSLSTPKKRSGAYLSDANILQNFQNPKIENGVDYQNVNEEFNRELNALRDKGKDYSKHFLSLGLPSNILKSIGIPNLNITIGKNTLLNSSQKNNGRYDLSDLKNLPEAINNPLIVFENPSETHPNRRGLLINLTNGKRNFLAVIQVNDSKDGVDLNNVVSIHPRNFNNFVNWINNKSLLYVDKKNTSKWLSSPLVETENQSHSDNAQTTRLIDTKLQNNIDKAIEKVENFQNPKIENESDAEYMRTPSGVIYGAKLPDGTIYINPEHLNANTPIHEFGHIWEQLMPNRFAKGVELLKNTKAGKELFQELRNNKGYKNYSDEKLWSEALVTMLGNRGEELYHSNSTSRFVAWVKDFFKALGDMLYKLSKGLVGRELTPEDKLSTFVKGALSDIMSGKEIIPESNIATKEVPIYLKDMDNSEIKQVLDRLGLIKPAQCA